MATTIQFTYGNTKFLLEFTRATVTQMEKNGFNPKDFEQKPLSTIPILFEGAFLAHHRNTSKSAIEEILNCMGDKEKLYETLATMYTEPIKALTEEPEEAKKVEWVVSK